MFRPPPPNKITYDQYIHDVHALSFSDDGINFRCNRCTMWATPVDEPDGDDNKQRAYTEFKHHQTACSA